MNFPASEKIERAGSNPIFMVTMPDVKPSFLLGRLVFIDDVPYRCTGIESSGAARPGTLVGLVVRPLKKDPSQLF